MERWNHYYPLPHLLTQGCGVRVRVKSRKFSLHLHNPAPKITTDSWLAHWLPALHWPYDHWLSRIVSQSVEVYSGEWIDSCCLCYLSYTLDFLAHPLWGYLYLFTDKNNGSILPWACDSAVPFHAACQPPLPASLSHTPLSPFPTLPPLRRHNYVHGKGLLSHKFRIWADIFAQNYIRISYVRIYFSSFHQPMYPAWIF